MTFGAICVVGITLSPIFEWYMLESGQKRDTCLENIGLCAQSMLIILGSTFNIQHISGIMLLWEYSKLTSGP